MDSVVVVVGVDAGLRTDGFRNHTANPGCGSRARFCINARTKTESTTAQRRQKHDELSPTSRANLGQCDPHSLSHRVCAQRCDSTRSRTLMHAKRSRKPKTNGKMKFGNVCPASFVLRKKSATSFASLKPFLSIHSDKLSHTDKFRIVPVTLSHRVMELGVVGQQDETKQKPNVSDARTERTRFQGRKIKHRRHPIDKPTT